MSLRWRRRAERVSGSSAPWLAQPLEAKDWVIIRPGGGGHGGGAGPLGTWVGGESGLLCVPEASLLRVPREVMGLDYLASHRALTTAYRLLESYGSLRLGDTIIQNNADGAVGLAVLQLCRMLRLSCINVVPDTPRFQEVSTPGRSLSRFQPWRAVSEEPLALPVFRFQLTCRLAGSAILLFWRRTESSLSPCWVVLCTGGVAAQGYLRRDVGAAGHAAPPHGAGGGDTTRMVRHLPTTTRSRRCRRRVR